MSGTHRFLYRIAAGFFLLIWEVPTNSLGSESTNVGESGQKFHEEEGDSISGDSGPGVSGLGVSGLGVSGLGVSGLGVSAPGVSGPGVSGPGVSGPGVSGPGVSGPGVSGPGVSGPGVSGPGVSGPGISGPGVSGPGVSGPGVSGPGDSCPGVSDRGHTGPSDSDPDDSDKDDSDKGASDKGDSGPGDSSPGDSGHGDSGPGNPGPGDSGPGDSGSGDSGSGDSGPGNPTEGSGEGFSGDGFLGAEYLGEGNAREGYSEEGSSGDGFLGVEYLGKGNAKEGYSGEGFSSAENIGDGKAIELFLGEGYPDEGNAIEDYSNEGFLDVVYSYESCSGKPFSYNVFPVNDLSGNDYSDEDEDKNGDGNKDCTPPPDSSAPVGVRGYRRYFANDSLIGRPVPCTRDDKICFRYNLVFDPRKDRCEALGEKCGGPKRLTIVDKMELEHGSGRVLGSCPRYADPCRGYRMAYDGLCYRKKIVRDVICGCNAALSPHILGGMECREEPLSPITVPQPEEDDTCVISDLNNPDRRRSMFLEVPLMCRYRKELKCGLNQPACFSRSKVFVQGYRGCHKLLKQGPCAEDHVVALDSQAANEGRAEGTCVHVRGGCPKGYKRMLFDGQCHEDRYMKLIAPGEILLDEFGRYFISVWNTEIAFILAYEGSLNCIIETIIDTISDTLLLDNIYNPPCGEDGLGECELYEVECEPPKPEFDDRK